MTVRFYADNAEQLASQYDSLSFEQVHQDWLWLLNELPAQARALDIGAGSGRDALALKARGFEVTAVEPADNLRAIGQAKSSEIKWYDDTLPELHSVKQQYHLILVSAVWMHLSPQNQHRSIKRLAQLLESDGCLVITLRHGEFADERYAEPINATDTIDAAEHFGLRLVLNESADDQLTRKDVYWQTLAFRKT